MLLEEDHNVQDEGDDHHQGVQDLELVVEELQAVGEELEADLHQEEGEDGKAQTLHMTPTAAVWVIARHLLPRDAPLFTHVSHPWGDLLFVRVNDLQIQKQLSQHQHSIQDHQANHHDLGRKGKAFR
ncbi:hypothetical protein E2320_012448 [Naja naja]|nr:hypothetical protein E2320_012448 [Naja naja]